MKSSCWRIIQFILILVLFTFAQEQQIEIADFYAKVYLAPNTSSRFIGLAQQGETYPILETRDSWVRIKFKNAVGWVQLSQVKNQLATQSPAQPSVAESSPKASDTTKVAEVPQVTASDTFKETAATDKSFKPDQAKTSEQVNNKQPQQNTAPVAKNTNKPEKSSQEKSQDNSQPKKDSKLRNWFNHQNIFTNLPANQQVEDLEIKYFQVTFGPARILLYLSPDAPILGMAKKGDVFPLIGEGDTWCKVLYADTVGWVERRNGKLIDAPKSLLASDFITAGVIVVILGFLVAILFIILRVMRKSRNKMKDISIQKNVVIIAKTNKIIQYTLTDTTTSLERCFSEIGFNITIIKEPQTIKPTLEKIDVDILIVDWKFDRNIISFIERFYNGKPGAEKILFIVYNTSDPTVFHPGQVLPNTAFLGQTFSDRDIFKLVTPQIAAETTKNVQKSVKSSALEGNIADGNLLEVLQFIEIGSKTGCLLIETDRPFGLIYFQNGRIIYAATAQEIIGRDAIFKILYLKEGKFRFILNRKPKSSNVNLSTLEILMEWTKAVDEAHGH